MSVHSSLFNRWHSFNFQTIHAVTCLLTIIKYCRFIPWFLIYLDLVSDYLWRLTYPLIANLTDVIFYLWTNLIYIVRIVTSKTSNLLTLYREAFGVVRNLKIIS